MSGKYRSVAIDGPSGAGKSTLAKMIAKDIGFVYVDTGAIYRTVGLYVLRCGVSSKDSEKITGLLDGVGLSLTHGCDGHQRMILNGQDVTSDIRMPEVSIYASDVSAIPSVRAFLLETQRDMAKKHDVIMDGRDIGTVVLPEADVKIFLTASPEERARRRYDELVSKGAETTYGDVLRDINYRDKNDSSREHAPLKAAGDAVIVNTTGNTLEKSREVLTAIIRKALDI